MNRRSRSRSGQLLENGGGIADRFLHRHLDDRLALEAIALLDIDVHREDDGVRRGDVGFSQLVSDAHRALRLDLDGVAERPGRFRALLGGDVGVGDAGGAGGDGDDVHDSEGGRLRDFRKLTESAVTMVPATIAMRYMSL